MSSWQPNLNLQQGTETHQQQWEPNVGILCKGMVHPGVWGGGRHGMQVRTQQPPLLISAPSFLTATLLALMRHHCLSVLIFLSGNKLCRGQSPLALVLNWFSGDSLLAQHGPLLTSRPVNSDYKNADLVPGHCCHGDREQRRKVSTNGAYIILDGFTIIPQSLRSQYTPGSMGSHGEDGTMDSAPVALQSSAPTPCGMCRGLAAPPLDLAVVDLQLPSGNL